MEKQTALKTLLDGMTGYSEKAKFSRVAGMVQETVLLAVVSQTAADQGQTLYVAGYADAILNVVERIAPKAEAELLMPVLWAVKNIVQSRTIFSTEIGAIIERLAA
jgi:hypothetical protein